MKKSSLSFLLLIVAICCQSQSISVKSFVLQESSQTSNKILVKDQNGETTALIKVVTAQTGFVFDGGALGIVRTEQKPSEIWVYVPRGIKKITISHPQFGILRNYYLPLSIKAACTYEMRLETTMPHRNNSYGYVEITSSPIHADIYIDGKLVGKTPQLISEKKGEHKIRIVKQSYEEYSSNFLIKENETNELHINLETKNKTFEVGDVKFTMVKVEGGTFKMGATSKQGNDVGADETPVHQVTLSTYYIGETEVTQGLWEAVMKTTSGGFVINNSNNHPASMVSWDDCHKFILKLNQLTGMNFRLPSEAEWEFAARGGNNSKGYLYSGSNNIEDVAWYESNSNKESHSIKCKQPNELGIFDMSGNVWEWCNDYYGPYNDSPQENPQGPLHGSYHVYRGGSCSYNKNCARSTCRNWDAYNVKSKDVGFRLAL